MFEYCNNIFEKISVVIAVLSVFALQFLGAWFLSRFLNLDVFGCIISQCFVAYFIDIFETALPN